MNPISNHVMDKYVRVTITIRKTNKCTGEIKIIDIYCITEIHAFHIRCDTLSLLSIHAIYYFYYTTSTSNITLELD